MKYCGRCPPPAVTHTKIGPCLAFLWRDEAQPLSVDLVPVFPVRSPRRGLLSLFNSAVRTLVRRKPENWVEHLRGIIERDRLLPETFAKSLEEDNEASVYDVAVKVLNYGHGDTHIIRPAQVTEVRELGRHGDKLRRVYARLKAARDLLRIADAKSYLIKKVVLLDEVKDAVLDPDMPLDEAMLAVASHPELKTKFDARLDLDRWAERIETRKRTGDDDAIVDIPLRSAR